ncbi:hypothetical protein J2P86_07360 [Staphylococcus sp. 30400_3112M30941]|nr:hypothetical protein [Staphylococcus sp. 30403_3112M30944]MBO0944637.1 hypothetical protein [Staphylococcus sp. 30402_3112M30943]MBO0964403.1 hypothetical protein [Staphylococcus sp. 30400_3112M30941]MBO0967334.1 hypothetical protein [Staphylococcus sp. 30401_3112M30942]
MVERYIKVLILYIFTTLLSSISVTSKYVPNKFIRFILRTAIGYSVFAYGLHFFSNLKKYKK